MQPDSVAALADPRRLAAVRDAVPEKGDLTGFHHLAALIVRVLGVPTALVSLVDDRRELVTGSRGLAEPWATRGELPLEYSYCRHVVAAAAPFLVRDARDHPLLHASPAIRSLRAIAYAGVPLRTGDGLLLGAVCAIDDHPRGWEDHEVTLLGDLAVAAGAEAEHRRALARERRRHLASTREIRRELADAERFRVLVERSLAGIYLVQDGRFAYANPRLHDLFGYDLGAIEGCPVMDLVAPEDRGRVLEQIRRRVEGEMEEAHYTFRGLRRDGALLEVEVHGTRVEVGARPAVLGTLIDITAARRAEERLRLVERATEDVIWEWDLRRGEIVWNSAAYRTFRFREAEVSSTSAWHAERIHPEDRARVLGSLEAVLAGAGDVWSAEYRFRRGDGRYATVLDRGCVVRGDGNIPVRVVGSMLDVTERKREEEGQRFLSGASLALDSSMDEEILLETLARFSVPFLGDCCRIDLVEESGEIRCVASAPGDAPPAGPLVERVVGTGFSVLLPDCDLDAVHEAGCTLSTEVVEPAGCSVMSAPLVVVDRTLGAITVATADGSRAYTPADLALLRDLARRAALSVDRARLYRHATEAVRAREELLATITHDLRNPLNAIHMSASLMRDAGSDRRSDTGRWLDIIERTARQMGTLVDELLDVSRIEAGRFSVAASRGSLADLVRDACDLLVPAAEERGVRLVVRTEGTVAPVWMDSAQLLRVISNLVGNAIKFSPPGGRVTLEVRRREADVHFSVRDEGPGIPPEHLSHVFDRYWQGRAGDRRGAGLGLAIARGIVEAHGGWIGVESEPGEGATFSFAIPAAQPSA